MNISDAEYEKYIRFYLSSMLEGKSSEVKHKRRNPKIMASMTSYIKRNAGDSNYLFSSPLCASLRLTDSCNFRCIHCLYSDGEYSSVNDLTTKQVLKLADELIKAGVAFIQITGGEVFLRPDIIDIIRKFKESNVSVTLLTNGSLLTDENINEISEIFNPYTDEIQISLDAASPETFRRIRRSDKFDKINENIKKLIAKGVIVDNVCTINNINKNEIVDIYKLAEALGTNHLLVGKIKSYNDSHLYLGCSNKELFKIYYDLMQNKSNNGPDLTIGIFKRIELLNISEVNKIIQEPAYYKLLKKETSKAIKKDCQNHNKVAINNNGNVSLCIEALSYDIEPLGNCKNNSFEEIWERRWNNILFQPRNREESQCGNCKYKTFCDSGCKIDAYVKSCSVNAPAIPNCRACH